MINLEDKTKCCGCTACMNRCPKDAIFMQDDEYGFKYPIIDKTKCIECGLCETVCPIMNKSIINNQPYAYACKNKNDKIRKDSSSGGIFTLLAEKIIDEKGIVFGAAFDNNFMVKHIYIDNKEDLYKLRTSKYLQSYIGETYKECEKFLKQGKIILFTGTPCQIEGLKTYLVKDYENLYTQDIICHGVPSPKLWSIYQSYRIKIDKNRPLKINFRNKDNGWNQYNLKFTYKEDFYKKSKNKDSFMKAFLSNLCLRKSCYCCCFKKYNRISDITLADYWGIKKVEPKFDDNKGTSLVIISSNKGKKLFESIKDNCIVKPTNIDIAISYNKSYTTSVNYNKNRDLFFKEINSDNFENIVNKYTHKSIAKKIYIIMRKILKKL